MTGSACPMSQGMPVEVHLLMSHRPHLVTWSCVVAGKLDSMVSLFFWAILYPTTTQANKSRHLCSGTLFRSWARLVWWCCPWLLGFLCGFFPPNIQECTLEILPLTLLPSTLLSLCMSKPARAVPGLCSYHPWDFRFCFQSLLHLRAREGLGKWGQIGSLLFLKSSNGFSYVSEDNLNLCLRSVGWAPPLTDFICMWIFFTRLQSYLPLCVVPPY